MLPAKIIQIPILLFKLFEFYFRVDSMLEKAKQKAAGYADDLMHDAAKVASELEKKSD